MNLFSNWILNRRINEKERERMFILIQAAGIEIYKGVLSYNYDMSVYPYMGYRAGGNVDFYANYELSRYQSVTLEELEETLINYIKDENTRKLLGN